MIAPRVKLRRDGLTLELDVGRRGIGALLAAFVLAANPAQLATERLTLTTYYPSPYGAYSHMRATNDTHLAYAAGSVTVGAVSPAAGSKFNVSGVENVSQFDGPVGVNGGFAGGYGSALTVSRGSGLGNVYVQGNENEGVLRVGDAWSMNGVYSEVGDLVVGAQSGRIRIGPDAGSQHIAHACMNRSYSFGAMTACDAGWSVIEAHSNAGSPQVDRSTQFYDAAGNPVLFWVNSLGDLRAYRPSVWVGNLVRNTYFTTLPPSGTMLCCKLQSY